MERRFFERDDPFVGTGTTHLVVVYGDGKRVLLLNMVSEVTHDRTGDSALRTWNAVLAGVHTGKWCEISEEDAGARYALPAHAQDMPRTSIEAW